MDVNLWRVFDSSSCAHKGGGDMQAGSLLAGEGVQVMAIMPLPWAQADVSVRRVLNTMEALW